MTESSSFWTIKLPFPNWEELFHETLTSASLLKHPKFIGNLLSKSMNSYDVGEVAVSFHIFYLDEVLCTLELKHRYSIHFIFGSWIYFVTNWFSMFCFVSPVVKNRGRPRKTITEIIKRYLDFSGLTIDIISDITLWHRIIHVADSP